MCVLSNIIFLVFSHQTADFSFLLLGTLCSIGYSLEKIKVTSGLLLPFVEIVRSFVLYLQILTEYFESASCGYVLANNFLRYPPKSIIDNLERSFT